MNVIDLQGRPLGGGGGKPKKAHHKKTKVATKTFLLVQGGGGGGRAPTLQLPSMGAHESNRRESVDLAYVSNNQLVALNIRSSFGSISLVCFV